jgi:hypothetical protein
MRAKVHYIVKMKAGAIGLKALKRKDVLKWFAERVENFQDFARDHTSFPNTARRPLARPNQPLEGSTAERKLDIGFVDDPKAGEDTRYHWSRILVPGELKSNPSYDTVSKTWLDLGRYVRENFYCARQPTICVGIHAVRINHATMGV